MDADTGEILLGHLTYGAARHWYDTYTRQGLQVAIVQDTTQAKA